MENDHPVCEVSLSLSLSLSLIKFVVFLQILVAETFYFVTDIKTSPKGFIAPIEDGEQKESHFVRVNSRNDKLYNGIHLKHENIVYCHSVHRGADFELFSFEPFEKSLRDIYTDNKLFWAYDKNGLIIGGTVLLKNIVLGLLDALIFLSKKAQICHGNTSSLDCVVFNRDNTPMLYNFSCSSKNPNGLQADIQGLGTLLRQLIPSTEFDLATSEVKNLVILLENYDSTSMDSAILKQHPALKSPKERREMVLKAGSVLKTDPSIVGTWSSYMLTRGKKGANLRSWLRSAQNSLDPTIKVRAYRRTYGKLEYTVGPASLIKFVRDAYQHVRDNNPNSKYTDEILEDLFKDHFPNLYVEWFCFRNSVSAQYDLY